MKHPLTSKERRGLLAVAAAALLCISSGFIFRNCSFRSEGTGAGASLPSQVSGSAVAPDSSSVSTASDSLSVSSARTKSSRKSKKDKKKTLKAYPTRDPLSEPCD
ncbi:MAG: hypothetical protein K2L45_01820 [Muribaculaceae bacterium]|nr:hypothetical protein [Muribaculaceae bacterium]